MLSPRRISLLLLVDVLLASYATIKTLAPPPPPDWSAAKLAVDAIPLPEVDEVQTMPPAIRLGISQATISVDPSEYARLGLPGVAALDTLKSGADGGEELGWDGLPGLETWMNHAEESAPEETLQIALVVDPAASYEAVCDVLQVVLPRRATAWLAARSPSGTGGFPLPMPDNAEWDGPQGVHVGLTLDHGGLIVRAGAEHLHRWAIPPFTTVYDGPGVREPPQVIATPSWDGRALLDPDGACPLRPVSAPGLRQMLARTREWGPIASGAIVARGEDRWGDVFSAWIVAKRAVDPLFFAVSFAEPSCSDSPR